MRPAPKNFGLVLALQSSFLVCFVRPELHFGFESLAPLSFAHALVLEIASGGGAQRASALPDLPTTLEAGIPNSDYKFWPA